MASPFLLIKVVVGSGISGPLKTWSGAASGAPEPYVIPGWAVPAGGIVTDSGGRHRRIPSLNCIPSWKNSSSFRRMVPDNQ